MLPEHQRKASSSSARWNGPVRGVPALTLGPPLQACFLFKRLCSTLDQLKTVTLAGAGFYFSKPVAAGEVKALLGMSDNATR